MSLLPTKTDQENLPINPTKGFFKACGAVLELGAMDGNWDI